MPRYDTYIKRWHNSQMEKLFSIIKSNLIGILIGSGILWWGFANDGYVRMIIGLLILFAVIKSGIDNFNYALELDNWIKQNQNSLILFYPCKKPIQDLIKDEFIPKIPFPVMEIYYDGPKLVGNIKRSIVLEIMKWNENIKIHEPSILKIKDKKVISETLMELRLIGKQKVDYQKLIEKIEKLKSA